MNNEPVAWIDKNTGKPRMEGFIQTDYDIPLYTHPADKKVKENTDLYEKMCNCTKKLDLTDEEDTECQYCKQGCIRCDARKTLTDEEIEQIGKEYGIKSVYQFAYYEFARAILRKAQEK